MSAPAYLPADYSSNVIKILEELRDGITNKRDLMRAIADGHNREHRFEQFENAYGQIAAFDAVLSDIGWMIVKEQGR
jgi:hypothetical protein